MVICGIMYEFGFILVVVALGVLGEKSPICRDLEFPCEDGSCVEIREWCDGHPHCSDFSDEDYCIQDTMRHNPNRCKKHHFMCTNGRCIPIIGRCDGIQSCDDHSDELDCDPIEVKISDPIEVKLNHATEVEYKDETLNPTERTRGTTEASAFKSNSDKINETSTSPTSTVSVLGNYRGSDTITLSGNKSYSSLKEPSKYVGDITTGFKEMDIHYFLDIKFKAETWLLETRRDEYGWGDETARAVTALYLCDPFSKKNENTLIIKELHLQLSLALNRNQTEAMTLSELASYINALHATCNNPRNFYGIDLVDILRHGTNSAQISAKYVSPLVYLTLCISNSSTYQDLKDTVEMLNINARNKIDTLALAALAATCLQSVPEFPSNYIERVASERLYDWINSTGFPENVYELSLAVQALNAAKINQDKWNRSKVIKLLASMQEPNGSFGDILSTYYALPVFSGKSLASLATHCHREDNGMIPLDILMNGKEKKKNVTYSLLFENQSLFHQDLTIKVGESTNFLDIMRIAEKINPLYRFKYDISQGKPVVFSIGGVANDAEKGLYWTMYVRKGNSTDKMLQFESDLRSYIPKQGDHITFWMKNVFEAN